jgi:hypothetical protein
MSSLRKLVADLKQTRGLASTDLEAIPAATKASWTFTVREAKERLEKLEPEYFKQVRSRTLAIIATGDADRASSFLELANEIMKDDLAWVAVDGLYRRLADKAFPTLGAKREFGPTQLHVIIRELQEATKDLGVLRMTMPALKSMEICKTPQETTSYIRKLIRDAVGDDLLKLYVNKAVNDSTLELMPTGETFPFLLVGVDDVEIPALTDLFSKAAAIDLGTSQEAPFTKDSVLAILAGVREKFGKKAETTNQQ